MYLKSLANHWSYSLNFFRLKNLKSFMFDSVKSLTRGWITLPWQFQIHYGVFLLIRSSTHRYLSGARGYLTIASYFMLFFFLAVILGLFVLAVRSDVRHKNLVYLQHYLNNYFVIFFPILCMITPLLLWPIYLVALLFFLDLGFSIKNIFISLKNTFFMIVHFFLPIFMMTILAALPIYFFYLFDLDTAQAWKTIEGDSFGELRCIIAFVGSGAITLALQFLYICMISTYYTKITTVYKVFFFGENIETK